MTLKSGRELWGGGKKNWIYGSGSGRVRPPPDVLFGKTDESWHVLPAWRCEAGLRRRVKVSRL